MIHMEAAFLDNLFQHTSCPDRGRSKVEWVKGEETILSVGSISSIRM